jgi:DNA-binding beta-propeller fold protein YncE
VDSVNKHLFILLAGAAAIGSGPQQVLAQFGGNAQQDSVDATLPTIPYEAEVLHLKTPDDRMVGETVGVALNSEGHIFVETRTGNTGPARGATAAALYEFDHDGNWVKEWGHGSYGWSFAHEVEVDRYDNVWVTDEGSNMVMKFNPQAEVELVLGRKAEAIDYLERYLERGQTTEAGGTGAGRPNSFDRPTNVTWDTDDNIYVADGYGNSRVAKFSPDGEYLGTIGTRGRDVGQFSTPHDIDSDDQGLVYVADRGNNRVQVLDNDLNVVRVIDGIRSPWAICISDGPTQYLYSADVGGTIYKVTLDGRVLGKFGSMGKGVGQIFWPHSLACPSENEIYLGEVQNWRVQRLTLSPPPEAR